MADKKIQPTNPTPAVDAKSAVEDKNVERKTSTRSRRASGRKTNGFHGA